MEFLLEYGFNPESINQLNNCVPSKLKEQLTDYKSLVGQNVNYLKELGVTNIGDVFLKYYDMFLLDYSTFVGIFDKYEPGDLIAKISKNINVIEIL